MKDLLADTLYHPENRPDDLSDVGLITLAKLARCREDPLPLPTDFYVSAANRGLILHRRKD